MAKSKTLEVQVSPVKTGGRVRINPDIKSDLDLEEGGLAIVSSETKDILVSTFYDEYVDEGKIILREGDRKKLNITEGESVGLRKHQSLLNKLL